MSLRLYPGCEELRGMTCLPAEPHTPISGLCGRKFRHAQVADCKTRVTHLWNILPRVSCYHAPSGLGNSQQPCSRCALLWSGGTSDPAIFPTSTGVKNGRLVEPRPAVLQIRSDQGHSSPYTLLSGPRETTRLSVLPATDFGH